MEKKSIGTFIAVLRKSSGMTQKDLADRLGVSDKTVSHWERDESAPDLTLIPVIAEVFGVTCDELLRGERARGISEEKESSGKTEKQVKHLLNLGRARFKTRSMISLGLSIAGLLAAMILNLGVNRAYLGFLIGCIFWAAAIICESVFYSHAFSAVSGDDFEGAELNDYKIYAVRLTGKVISASAVMICASLPLIIIPPDAFWGVTVGTWFLSGLLFAALAAVICLFVTYAVNNALISKGVYKLDKITDIRQHNYSRLKLRCIAVTSAILFVMFLAQLRFYNTAGADAFAAGTTFDNFAGFKAYMETEKPGEEESPVQDASQLVGGDTVRSVDVQEYFDINGNPITKEQAWTEYIYDNAGNVLYQYVHLNREVTFIKYDSVGDEVSITAYTSDQLRSGQAAKDSINGCLLILYFIAAGIGLAVYFRKRAKLDRSL